MGVTAARDRARSELEVLLDDFGRVHRLSRRERSVVDLAASAVHDKEIAARLGCSLKTVEVFWRRIYLKTGRRGHAAVLAGIIQFGFGARTCALANETPPPTAPLPTELARVVAVRAPALDVTSSR